MFHNILNNEGKHLAHEISQFLRIVWAYYSSFLGFRAQATRVSVSYKPVSYKKKIRLSTYLIDKLFNKFT